jgi:hypothetical protein
MMAEVIVVAPTESAWRVQRGTADPWLFETRAQAEWSARRLGEALADGGVAAEIRIQLGDGKSAGRFVFAPAAPDPLAQMQPAA